MVTAKYDLDQPILQIPDNGHSVPWTIRDAVEGLQILGGIGSGKTSGSGRMIALKYLSLGFGGVVLTAKPDEKAMWQEYCRLTGRTKDLVIVEPGRANFFNFLEYISTASDQTQSYTRNILQVLKTVLQASEQKSTGKTDDPFWEKALDLVMFHVIELAQLAYGKVTVQHIYNIVQSLPKKPEQGTPANTKKEEGKKYSAYDLAFIAAQGKVEKLIKDFRANLSAGELQRLDDDGFEQLCEEKIPDVRRIRQVDRFFFEVLHDLSSKTRSVLDFTFMGFLFDLLQEPVYSLFCQHASTFTPEDCYQKGKIILINLPVKLYHKAGRDTQILFKYIWQLAMEKRNVEENDRPVFLWADEAQNFLHEHDAEYQATARSSRIATVYISQNLPNYYANMGGKDGEYKVKSFLGTLATKIFHANADIETNKFSEALIGKGFQEEVTTTKTIVGKEVNVSEASKWTLMDMVRAEEFVGLKTGGPRNNYKVSAIIHMQGKTFRKGFNHLPISFNQKFKP